MTQQALFDADKPVIGQLEDWCVARGYRYIIGVDEAGRGPLAGPVHAAAVAVDLEALDADWLSGLDDSKKLSAAQRRRAFDRIEAAAPAAAIADRDHQVIDDINILEATHRAMEAAIGQVCERLDGRPDYVFVDGNRPVNIDLAQRAVVKGDARSLAIAAASILAKVSRDRVMVDYHRRWPAYGFDSHKGYPTVGHRQAVADHGPCPIHRRTFGGVREYVDDSGSS